MKSKPLAYTATYYIRKEKEQPAEKPADIGMILKPSWVKSKSGKYYRKKDSDSR